MHGVRPPLVCALALVVALSAASPAGAASAEMPWSVLSRYEGFPQRMDTRPRKADAWLDGLGVFQVVVQPPQAVCAAPGSARWTVDLQRDAAASLVQPGPACRLMLQVEGEGAHRISVRAPAPGAAGVARIVVDDRLVVALGDSVASGEGNPEPGRTWLDPACHRSSKAGFEQAARLLGESLHHRSITFVSLACSGAEIGAGLRGPYAGVDPERGRQPYTPQVERLREIAGARPPAKGRGSSSVDAVLLSVGANDIGFSSIVKACALPANCRRARQEQVFADLERLQDEYDGLGLALGATIPRTRVLISEYFDPTHDEQGEFCPTIFGATTPEEVRWAFEGVLRPLNAEVSAAAVRNHWRLVGGIADDFGTHGYCADRVDRWVRRLEGSLYGQLDVSGTLHPSGPGHADIGYRVAVKLNRVLGLGARPQPPPPAEKGRPWYEWLGLAVAAVLAAAALLAGGPLAPLVLAGAALYLLYRLALRLLRLALRPSHRPDPSGLQPGKPAVPPRPRIRGPWQTLAAVAVGVGLIAVATLFAGVVGSTILWLRFWSARLPADQAVDGVSRGEILTTGTQALAVFVLLGLLAVGLAWMLDGKGQWVRATRRGLVAIGVAEVLAAILIGDFPERQALQLLGGLTLAALLLHFLLDRALSLRPLLRAEEPLGRALIGRFRALELRRAFLGARHGRSAWEYLPLFALRAIPLLLLLVAVDRAFTADAGDRELIVLAPLLAAAALFVIPPGIAAPGAGRRGEQPGALEGMEAPRIALAAAGLVCILVLIARDEAWLAAAAGLAALLGLFCLAVAAASGARFAPYGLAVLVAVPLFGAGASMLRGVDSPELQPVALMLESGKAVCGVYVGESDGTLWLGRLQLDERADIRRPRSGDLLSFDSDRVSRRALGPLEPVAEAQSDAVVLRDGLLDAHGKRDLTRRAPTCEPREAPLEVAASWQRRLAERYQPELVIDRRDGFWPIPVKTLFSMHDRRAATCRQVAKGGENCIRLTTQGQFPWAGGKGEAIEYPASNTDGGDQHDLMTAALGTSDPDRSATEYYLVSGRRRGGGPITIQYWFFYSFNYQPLAGTDIFKGGYHEGDFESVGVLLSGGEHRPRYIWMNRHNEEGRVFPWSDATLQRTGDHPSVFVARGSHASYESCSDQVRFVVKHHVVDDHPACEERNPLHLAPEATPLTDLSRVAWACWQGNFGHRKGKGGFERIPHLVDDAPLSPLWQQRLGGVVSEPCRGVNDPGGRDGPGEEVVEEETGVPAKLRRRSSRANTLVDECSDWNQPPAVGAYMVACSQPDLTAYLRSGLQDPGSAGLRIDVASSLVPEIGEETVPAVRSDPSQRYFDEWRIASAGPAEVSVFASCRQGERVVAARFKSVSVDPRTPLRLLDRGPGGIWRLAAEDGTVAATAAPFISDFTEDGPVETAPKAGETLACGGA